MTAVFSFKNTIYSSTWCLDNKCYDAVAVLSNNMQKHVANYTHQYKIIMLQQNIQFLLWICFLLNPVVVQFSGHWFAVIHCILFSQILEWWIQRRITVANHTKPCILESYRSAETSRCHRLCIGMGFAIY